MIPSSWQLDGILEIIVGLVSLVMLETNIAVSDRLTTSVVVPDFVMV